MCVCVRLCVSVCVCERSFTCVEQQVRQGDSTRQHVEKGGQTEREGDEERGRLDLHSLFREVV